jgi:hypothetical protein
MTTNDQVEAVKAVVPIGPEGVEFPTIDAMFRFADCYLQSGLAPKSFQNAQQLVIAWVRAKELGIPYMQALEGMSIINGRLGLMGDLALALAMRSGQLEDKRTRYSGEGDTLTCFFELKRRGHDWKQYSFSVGEAKRAFIYERSPTWKGYPKRMTYYRALGFALRDEFPEVLRGMHTTEELEDLHEITPVEADQQKYADSRMREAADKALHPEEYVTTGPAPESAAQAVEPAFDEDREETAFVDTSDDIPMPPIPEAGPQVADPTGRVAEFLKAGPPDLMAESAAAAAKAGTEAVKRFNESLAKEQAKPVAPAASAPVLTEPAEAPAPPQAEEWREHTITGIDAFKGKKIGELKPFELAAIENKWIPAMDKKWDDARADQQAEYPLFKAAIQWNKSARPW